MDVPLIDDVWKTLPHASIPGEPVDVVKLTPQAVSSLVAITGPQMRGTCGTLCWVGQSPQDYWELPSKATIQLLLDGRKYVTGFVQKGLFSSWERVSLTLRLGVGFGRLIVVFPDPISNLCLYSFESSRTSTTDEIKISKRAI